MLLLWGAQDQITPLRYGERLVHELTDASLKVYPRCGHIPMVEAAHDSTRDLIAFLDADLECGDGVGAVNAFVCTALAIAALAQPARAVADSTATGSAGSADEVPNGFGPPPVTPVQTLPIGADLAAIGAELTPRQYAAPRDQTEIVVHGGLRARAADYYNLDLDRGLDARGQPLFPVPLDGGQSLQGADFRARTDIAIYARGIGVAVKSRIDWLDNVPIGGDPDLANGSPALAAGQRPTTVVIKRVWGEALTPFGTLAVGRMGANFGLGIAANGGDCEDRDHSDLGGIALAFVSPIAGHIVALAYDIASTGPFTESKDGGHTISLSPSDRAAGPTLAIHHVHSPAALATIAPQPG